MIAFMGYFLSAVLSQGLLFLPLAWAISISYRILRVTDMTLDGSFVLGAAVFSVLITHHCPPGWSFFIALGAGALSGAGVSLIQRQDKIDSLLAGILAAFILSSVNLWVMGRPNISLMGIQTLISPAFERGDMWGWGLVSLLLVVLGILITVLLRSRVGTLLRAFGDNPGFLKRIRGSIEPIRLLGFMLTNSLAAFSGILTAQVQGFADVGMGLGMTLTGIGTIILGAQCWSKIQPNTRFSLMGQWMACCMGILLYFGSIHLLLRFDVPPLFLKLMLGLLLIFFLRGATNTPQTGKTS